ncbi:MAG: hypothetical protein JNL05_10100 [Flavobacteriales bacterium]|nr:hypothetical protein [Flavobacteriales bacterium]
MATSIQVDMFEVQLGAALLLQFGTSGGKPVRVLADAGIKASGYPEDHVRKKLPGAFKDFAPGKARIDLIIGTHYDEDHLSGLAPIIADPAWAIGEAWLPPVLNDEAPAAPRRRGARPVAPATLAQQLAGENAAGILSDYLKRKADLCEMLLQLEDAAAPARRARRGATRSLPTYPAARRGAAPAAAQLDTYFRAQLTDARAALHEVDATHADEPAQQVPVSAAGAVRRGRANAPVLAATYTAIRKAEAAKAINAMALAEVVNACVKRGVPIRCEMIPDGVPVAYKWSAASKRFVKGKAAAKDLGLVLLGPSQGLANKHAELLPVAQYARRGLRGAIAVKSITPSNQLSYVARFTHAGQHLLVTGDAGCVDWSTAPRKPYHKALLNELKGPLHVVQVAHHGGNNAHFYNVLLAADYAAQQGDSYLLLSHATNDKTRPSTEFRAFVEEVKHARTGMRLLFTSKPKAANAKGLKPYTAPTKGAKGTVGDVRLVHAAGTWSVARHAVQL